MRRKSGSLPPKSGLYLSAWEIWRAAAIFFPSTIKRLIGGILSARRCLRTRFFFWYGLGFAKRLLFFESKYLYRKLFHFFLVHLSRRLFWNSWTDFNKTWQEVSLTTSTKFVFFWPDRKNKMAAVASDWLRNFDFCSKPLNRIQRNLTGRKMVEDVEIFLPVKFCWIPSNGFRAEVEISQPIRGHDGHPVFSDRPKKHKLGRRR